MMLSTLLILLPLAVTAFPTSSPIISARQTPALEEETDRLLFEASMSEFQAARAAQDPPELDWSSNGCTASPDNPLGFNFLQSCQRHDFGYRNYKAQSRFTDAAKDRIDDNFHADMDAQCAAQAKNGVERGICEGVATLYYEAVSTFGSKRRGVEMEVAGVAFRE